MVSEASAADVTTFGVREFARAGGPLDAALESISIRGYTIVPNVLDPAELDRARAGLDRIYQVQIEECGGEDRLRLINDLYTVRAPLAYDDFFLDVATKPEVLTIVQAILGEYVCLMLQNGVINVPRTGREQNAGDWHRDLNYQHFVSSRPLSISALFCVDPFSAETGGTVMLPHSHRAEAFPSAAYVTANAEQVEAPAGSAIVFDSMLFHRGGLNRSQAPRRAINHMYTIPLLKPQISFPKVFGERFSSDPFLRRFLGYETEPAGSAHEFRAVRIDRLKA